VKLTVWLPSEVLLEEEVVRIQAQAENGWFGILPKHVDTVTSLVPSVLVFQKPGQAEEYLAVDHGILVKCGPDVRVSTRNAVRGTSLEELKGQVERQFREREELEKKARAFEAKLETDLVRRLLEEEKHG
jgi:F-type H+-transporting ATPase subunit epsilon